MSITDIKAIAQTDVIRLLEPKVLTDGGAMVDIDTIVSGLYNASILIGIILGVIVFTAGAFKFALSETPFVKSDGKSEMSNALVGVLILLVSFLILQTIGVTNFSIVESVERINNCTKQLITGSGDMGC